MRTEAALVVNAIQRIASDTLKGGLPGYDLFDRIIEEIDVLWGCIKWTKGSRSEILIEGGPRFCQAALRNIEEHSKAVEIVTKHLRPQLPWHRRLFGAGE
jgi:hypothetical protein